MKKINTTLLLGALLGFCACHFESFDERCAREAREYTEKQCPRRMDQYTLMDSLTYDDHSRTLNYYYTLEGVLDNDTVMNAQACESLKDLLRKNVVNSVDLKSYKEKGCPSESISPEKSVRPSMDLNSVVLPAPFGPSTP